MIDQITRFMWSKNFSTSTSSTRQRTIYRQLKTSKNNCKLAWTIYQHLEIYKLQIVKVQKEMTQATSQIEADKILELNSSVCSHDFKLYYDKMI
jgi:hypothetical protein